MPKPERRPYTKFHLVQDYDFEVQETGTESSNAQGTHLCYTTAQVGVLCDMD